VKFDTNVFPGLTATGDPLHNPKYPQDVLDIRYNGTKSAESEADRQPRYNLRPRKHPTISDSKPSPRGINHGSTHDSTQSHGSNHDSTQLQEAHHNEHSQTQNDNFKSTPMELTDASKNVPSGSNDSEVETNDLQPMDLT
jgi:hypothetical protein